MLSRVLGQLSEAGLVHRRADPGDRRAAIVEPTAAGRRLRERIRRERTDVMSVHLAALSDEQRESVLEALPALEALAEQLKDRRA
jgi:DNA-binding MarR family transcriptional regulator